MAKPQSRRLRKSTAPTTALYISNMPFMTIKDVKTILAAAPINIQLRDIRNLSWIDKHLLEMLVDSNHADRIKNRVGKKSDYYVKSDFDPLCADSFDWEGDILPESKEALLKRNFVLRLSASMTSTNKESTRYHIMDWAKHRGIGQELQQHLHKVGIIVSPSNQSRDTVPQTCDSAFNTSGSSSKLKPAIIIASGSKDAKRKLSISSLEDSSR